MAIATWPSLLQEYMDSSWAESEDIQFTVFEPEIGPKKTRRTVTKSFKKVTCSITSDVFGYKIFMSWWNNDIAGGNNSFTYKHPITEELVEYKMANPYKINMIGNIMYKIAMEWVEV